MKKTTKIILCFFTAGVLYSCGSKNLSKRYTNVWKAPLFRIAETPQTMVQVGLTTKNVNNPPAALR
ncbi:hypothetical protein [Flavobacterium phragmitis]|uniref:Uncharacterized protein n=1 Tax=Flavobacterium phragmitis TaxID=739143 RepID=A0A1I1LRP0_9FLAO|nr:hypothetical protein [Flavobacterium phragmitis]SFC72110.1 hypothetical protein SAMN05216297_1028 [Flavobacterium phragmitis]